MNFYSPLRYPGGKRKIADYVCRLIDLNSLYDCNYVEPFAGGASVALTLLFKHFSKKVYINDLDPSIYEFWFAVLNDTDKLCGLISSEKITVENWHKHRRRLLDNDFTPTERAFSFFYLNRTNRSGIINAGVIGGKNQSGRWKLDVRFNKKDLIERIRKIARHKNRITLTNLDAKELLNKIVNNLNDNTLIYLDPPYYVKGGDLYTHNFKHKDHEELAKDISTLKYRWIVSYDNVVEIDKMYSDFRRLYYGISYTAQSKYVGKELMVFSENLDIPFIADPTKANQIKLEFDDPWVDAPKSRLENFFEKSA